MNRQTSIRIPAVTAKAPTTRFCARLLLALFVSVLAACSSMQPVSIESGMRYSPPPGVDFGKLVEVTPIAGKKVEFRVTDITDEGLGGTPGFYRYADMKSLKVESTQGGDTDVAAIVLGVLGVAALVWLIGNADSVAICSPPCPTPTR